MLSTLLLSKLICISKMIGVNEFYRRLIIFFDGSYSSSIKVEYPLPFLAAFYIRSLEHPLPIPIELILEYCVWALINFTTEVTLLTAPSVNIKTKRGYPLISSRVMTFCKGFKIYVPPISAVIF